MTQSARRAIAIVGVGAVLPDAPDVNAFWSNVKAGRSSIGETPADRWDTASYYDADPAAPDRTYSKIGGWVTQWEWDPLAWRLPIPPSVSAQMDRGQQWAIVAARQALMDFGWPTHPLDANRTAVILGNAMAGDRHYLTALRVYFPEYAHELERAPDFATLPREIRERILKEMHDGIAAHLPPITEDTMPGELANIIAGRVANVLNLHGPNFVVDAACASAMAAIDAAVEGLERHDYDAVLTGGVDANMSASTFVKFCKIGALSATGSRPYANGADGFVMGEGAAVFLLRRLEDAERDGDRVYAVIRGIGGASDGKGKGITAPNPIGQRLAIERAWEDAALDPATATMVEGHGTSTKVGDVIEAEGISTVFGAAGAHAHGIALGSVKSNIGHLKAAAGAAGVLKTALALHHKVLPPSLNFDEPNPNIDFAHAPFYVNTELREWRDGTGVPRRAGVSAFGFGGTNFHVVMEEYAKDSGRRRQNIPLSQGQPAGASSPGGVGTGSSLLTLDPSKDSKPPLRGALLIGAPTEADIAARLRDVVAEAQRGIAAAPRAPNEDDLHAAVRLAIDYGDAAELAAKGGKALRALESSDGSMWRALRAQGVFLGRGKPVPIAFLYTGQGSQYGNMLAELRANESIVARTFAEADEVMTPILGSPLTDHIFIDDADPEALKRLEEDLRQTEITQPAVLAADEAITRLLAAYGIRPSMVIGHSLGEYGALVASGALTFADALRAVSARAHAMREVSLEDNGVMAAVFAPLADVERVLESLGCDVVPANINSSRQVVIGGPTRAMEQAIKALREVGMQVSQLPVSHAFHTRIVAPASEPLRAMLQRLAIQPPQLPTISNVTGRFYPAHANAAPEIIDLLARQVASPVRFVDGLETLYDAGARVYVETGPKRALHGFVEDVLGNRGDVLALFTNHPKAGDVVSFNQALCGLYAEGHGNGIVRESVAITSNDHEVPQAEPVVITGAALGLPGLEHVFDDDNVRRLLRGDGFIDIIPTRMRRAMLDKHITRLVKGDDGDAHFETIGSVGEVIKLAGRAGTLDLVEEFGFPDERLAALDRASQLAIGAGIDALRDAGIPLAMSYRTTTRGTLLPDRWMLPEALRDDTGVIFASAFPGYDAFADEITRYHEHRARVERRDELLEVRQRLAEEGARSAALAEMDRRIHEVEVELARAPYALDRRLLFRILAMGHSQFAEYIGARGPNTQVNAACASTPQAVAVARDWIADGRCRRVIVIAADEATSDRMFEWIGAGFLASGAAATEDIVEEAALPFDRRRHGMIVGMGAAALVLESAAAARERGVRPITELLSTIAVNSAYHGTRLDVEHIAGVMERLVSAAERDWGIRRADIAGETVFVSHETYTPARGGSAAAEILALRRVFGADADRIVIANTKGYTGHAMGAGIEDVLAVKSLETGLVPPVANFREVDPDLGDLRLSRGGRYPIRYALRLGAGFGSQVAMTLQRLANGADVESRPAPDQLGYAGRIVDQKTWTAWLERTIGKPAPALEIVKRTLRVADVRVETRQPETTPRQSETTPRQPETTVCHPEPKAQDLAPAPDPSVAPLPQDDVESRVLAIVAEQTGYPVDMLDPDLDMEADLGIDTVKQAEMFAAVRTAWNIPRDEQLRLRDFPTLRHVMGFVRERAVSGAPRPDSPVAPLPQDDIQSRVLAIVAEQTGYPVDMLDPALDLEADLGIDTVKQAEMFAHVRQAWNIPRDEQLRLRDYPTLAHVVQFVRERCGTQDAGRAATATAPTSDVAAAPQPDGPRGDAEAARTIVRRVPVAVLRPPLDLCKSTGVSLGADRRVLIMPDEGLVADALVARLRASDVEVVLLDRTAPAADIERSIADVLSAGGFAGLYWLPALDDEGTFPALDPSEWRNAIDRRVKRLYSVSRAVYDRLVEGTFVVAATRTGGVHGTGDAPAVAPLGGAVDGFVKALQRERPDTLVKVVDFDVDRTPADVARLLIEETLRDPGATEIGYVGGDRIAIGLAERASPAGEGPMKLDSNSIFVVTGAAGSIVSAITRDLASASGGIFYLIDLVPPPDPADPEMAQYLYNRDALKREIGERLAAHGERVTPALVERELAKLERARAALSAIQTIEWAGGTARYFSADLRDAQRVAEVIDAVRREHGRIDVLLHAAGLEISHLLPDKSADEFTKVFDVKADGWYNLLHAIGDMPLGAAITFSSIAGRFGNAGQTDYSAANELLARSASALERLHPETRALVLDWTAWSDIGMASRGSIPKMMVQAGIEMLPPAAGIPIVGQELATGTRGEVVVAKRLGALMAERDETGGVDIARIAARERGPMLSNVHAFALYGGLSVSATLDPTTQPFLDDHRIDGTAVLPGVMGLEAFAEAASLFFPECIVAAIEDVRFLAPFKFYRDEPREVTVHAQFVREGRDVVAECRLEGRRDLARGEEVTTHFIARVRLATAGDALAVTPPVVPQGDAPVLRREDIYRMYFHGEAYRVLERAWRAGDEVVGEMRTDLPPNHVPPELPLAIEPRLIELAFQTAGLSEIADAGVLGLPAAIRRVDVFHTPSTSAAETLYAIVRSPVPGEFDVQVVDAHGIVHVALEGYTSAPMPGPIPIALLEPIQSGLGPHVLAGAGSAGAVSEVSHA